LVKDKALRFRFARHEATPQLDEDTTMTVSDLVARLYRERWLAEYTGSDRPTAAEIARLAYHFYEMRDRENGHDVEDWLLAEQELTQHYWLVADHT
jgi:hypothetical protein